MADFINTIDVIGDDAVTDSFIERTITEFNDNMISKVERFAFAYCTSLTSVNMPNVTSIEYYAFQNCTSLTTVDFSNLTSIASGAFYSCTSLKTVILRNTTQVCTLANTIVFSSKPADGYFYVPRALVDGYKTNSNWSTYANQIRALEDYTVDGTINGELDENKI